jgi:hypothetical protein
LWKWCNELVRLLGVPWLRLPFCFSFVWSLRLQLFFFGRFLSGSAHVSGWSFYIYANVWLGGPTWLFLAIFNLRVDILLWFVLFGEPMLKPIRFLEMISDDSCLNMPFVFVILRGRWPNYSQIWLGWINIKRWSRARIMFGISIFRMTFNSIIVKSLVCILNLFLHLGFTFFINLTVLWAV